LKEETADAPLRRRLLRNTFWNQLSQSFRMVFALVLLPYIVNRVGPQEAGVYFLALSFTGYFGVLDASISPALVKIVAEYRAKRDSPRIGAAFRATFRTYAATGILAFAALWAASVWGLSFLGVPPHLLEPARQTLRIASLASLFSWPLYTYDHLLRGYQRYDLVSAVSLGVSALSFAAQIGAASMHLGAAGLMFATSVCLVGGGVVSRALARARAPEIKAPGASTLEEWRGIARFSAILFVISLTDVVVYQLDRLVAATSTALGVAAVTIYEYAARLHKVPRDIHAMVVAAITPAASELEAKGDHERLVRLVLEASRLTVAVTLPIATAILALTPAIAASWAPPEASVPIAVFVSYWVLNCNTGVLTNVLIGIGKLRLILLYAYSVAGANLALSIVLARRFGVAGVVGGTTIAYVIGFPFFMSLSLKTLGASRRAYAARVFWPAYPMALLLAGLVGSAGFSVVRFAGFPGVVAVGAIGVAAYYGAFGFVGMSRKERRELLEALPIAAWFLPHAKGVDIENVEEFEHNTQRTSSPKESGTSRSPVSPKDGKLRESGHN